VLSAAAGLLLAPVVPGAGAEVVCTRPSGAVVIRAACRTRERLLDLAAIGASGPKGDPGPAGLSVRFRAVDSTGQEIGFVVALGYVVHTVGGRSFALDAGTGGFRRPSGVAFYHEQPGCTSPRLVPAFGLGALIKGTVILGTTAYYPGDPLTMRTVRSYSASTTQAECTGIGGVFDAISGLCCHGQVPLTIPVGEPVAVDLGRFVPPFHLEMDGGSAAGLPAGLARPRPVSGAPATLCRTRRASVVARRACRRREVAVSLPKGPPGPAGADGEGLHLEDAAGRRVGLVAQLYSQGAFVAFALGDRMFSLRFNSAGVIVEFGRLFHETGNCSDAPLMQAQRDAFVFATEVLGTTAYYPAGPIEPRAISGVEYFSGCPSPGGGRRLANGHFCCPWAGNTLEVAPATALDLAALGVTTPPFHLAP
jgi:hypothetical protein